ncbi:hypothetical protein BKA82DRAFT_4009593 [Pisolithus tinctorius]|nr:hypothetical protein BKA82DRAFT_4009593 [Pisolithus tinctorius]
MNGALMEEREKGGHLLLGLAVKRKAACHTVKDKTVAMFVMLFCMGSCDTYSWMPLGPGVGTVGFTQNALGILSMYIMSSRLCGSTWEIVCISWTVAFATWSVDPEGSMLVCCAGSVELLLVITIWICIVICFE